MNYVSAVQFIFAAQAVGRLAEETVAEGVHALGRYRGCIGRSQHRVARHRPTERDRAGVVVDPALAAAVVVLRSCAGS